MFGTKYLNDEHDCNVVSTNSLNIHNTNDDCTSYDENTSYKHVNFVEQTGFASTHQIGKIDIARGISIQKLNCCKKGQMFVQKDSIFIAILVNFAMNMVI